MKSIFITTVFFLFASILIQAQTTDKTNSQIPSWAKEAIWYQIFPERFSNGDKSNDPKPIDMEGAWPYFVPEGWQVHPWTSDWYKLQPWEVKTEKDFYWNAGVRRYGGDLQGVIDKLDYLKELGISAIYLNPIFEAPSLHKYDATFYHHIDNNFGPDPDGDVKLWKDENPSDASTWKWTSADKLFLTLIEEAHKRGMKIIIDGVFNHTGTQFWAFKDIVKNQQNSKYKDWYTILKWDDPNTSENEFDYAGWYGVKDLPEIREDENGLLKEPSEHIYEIVKRWMDPNNDGDPSDGIDGWRLDVAEQVNHNFWKTFRTWVKDINPDAYIVGEIWWDDWTNYKMMDASPWLKGDQFDAVMNYRFVRALKSFIINKKEQIDAQGLIDSLNTLYVQYPMENNYVMMNLLGSHDVERISSMTVNPDIWYDHNGNPSSNKDFNVRKPNDEERLKQKLITGMQFTLLGAPQIYYGDEAGMWGGDDPDCRKPMVWADMNYVTETTHPFGKERQPDEVKFDQDIFNWYKDFVKIRNDNKVLSHGNVQFQIVDNEKRIICYKREWQGNSIVMIVNNNSSNSEIKFDANKFLVVKDNWQDLLTGLQIKKQSETISLMPYQIMILK